MEYRDLYNLDRTLTGKKIMAGEPIPIGSYIMVVIIFIENDKSEFLIQKCSAEKGGKWAMTGGHPKSGETSLEGIITEVKEELGIKIGNPILFKQGNSHDHLGDLYYLKANIDLNDLTIQKEEISDVKWATVDEIDELMAKGEFKKGHYVMLEDCLNYLKKGTTI